MEIINTHIHLGGSRVIDSNYSEESVLADMANNGLTGCMVYPLAEPTPDNFQAHDRVYKFIQDPPDKNIWGVADMHPRHDEDVYFNEVKRCVKELGFKAIKLHPLYHAVSPTHKAAEKVFRAARELDVPVIIHTGTGAPLAMPSLVIPRIQQFPEVKIVLAHAGGQYFDKEAIIVAKMFENVYLEPSWCNARSLKAMLNAVGKERIIFGSDGDFNTKAELVKPDIVGFTEEEKEWYFAKSAKKLYRLD